LEFGTDPELFDPARSIAKHFGGGKSSGNVHRMDATRLLDGLWVYLCFIPVLTFHEFAHAWVAYKCGDDTAKSLGRVSLNPIVHMELVGTVILPLFAIYLAMTNSALSGFIIGWGKPVPVNISNLKNPRRDDTLIALAGPGMNLLLAIVLMAFTKFGFMAKNAGMEQVASILIPFGIMFVQVNLILAFFNLIPIPPLDGSHVLKNAINMSFEAYIRLAQMGLVLIIVVLNFTPVRTWLAAVTEFSMVQLLRLYGLT
jgi:Zn-dependent protease